jgi:hypothetical protein
MNCSTKENACEAESSCPWWRMIWKLPESLVVVQLPDCRPLAPNVNEEGTISHLIFQESV